jgi:hypothetical protein
MSGLPANTPTTIAGCRCWLDGNDSNSMTFASGSNIQVWQDKSGVGNNATTVSAFPQFANPGVFFNNTLMSYNFFLSTSFSYFLVADMPINRATYYFSGGGPDSFGFAPAMLGDFGGPGALRFYWSQTGANEYYEISSFVTGRFLGEAIRVANNHTTGWYVGNLGYSNAVGPGFQPFNGRIGGYPGGTNESVIGNIYEFIAYTNAVSTTDRQKLEGYLAWKWNLQTKLPITHPYSPFAIPPAPQIFIRPKPIASSIFFTVNSNFNQLSSYSLTVVGPGGSNYAFYPTSNWYQYLVTNLSFGTYYSASVVQRNSNGVAGPSTIYRTIQTGNKPNPVQNLTGTINGTNVTLDWNFPTYDGGATIGWYVIRNLLQNNKYNVPGTFSTYTTALTVPGSNVFSVEAVNDPGYSPRTYFSTVM